MKFEEILVLATFVLGFICLIDVLFFRKKRIVKYNLDSSLGDSIGIELDKSKEKKEYKDPIIIEYSRSFFPVLLLVLVLRSFLAEPFRIPTGSMKPTLLEGDHIVVNKFTYGLRLPLIRTKLLSIGKPKHGDVIVFHHTKKMDLIKRIVGLPGDKIKYKNKILYINDKPIKEKYLGKDLDIDVSGVSMLVEHRQETLPQDKIHDIYKKLGPNHVKYEFDNVTVPEGQYFVLGDNRDNSVDSRFWGFVEEKNIIGRAFATWLSWDSVNKDVRWNRMGKVIN